MADKTVTTTKKEDALEGLVKSEAFKRSLAEYASRIDPAIFAKVFLNQIRKTPLLSQCTSTSVFDCLTTCAQLGLIPDGRLAHLIPFKNTKEKTVICTLIIDYKGLAELAFENGDLKEPIFADVVCKNDVFEWNRGRVVKHSFDLEQDRGPVIGAYAIATFVRGGERHELLTKAELEKVRKSSRAADSGPWVDWYEAMCKKTVSRRLCKWLKLTPDQAAALDREERISAIDIKPVEIPRLAAVEPQEAVPQIAGEETKEPAADNGELFQ